MSEKENQIKNIIEESWRDYQEITMVKKKMNIGLMNMVGKIAMNGFFLNC